MTASGTGTRGRIPALWWALLAGNFVIGCGVMVAAGALNDLARDLDVTVPVGGQMITVAAIVMGLGAPLIAALVGGWDRRTLLAGSLVWYSVGHALVALAPSFAALLPVRALSVLSAAAFTPQAAAALSVMTPAHERGRAVTFIFLGWSLSSVLGLPLASWIAETAGWRWAFALVAALALPAAGGVWWLMPRGVRPPPLSLAAWGRVFTHPALMAVVAVTACSAAGQFTLVAYMAPFFRQALGASASASSALFLVFGAFGVVGNVLLTRHVDRLGPARCVTLGLLGIALGLAVWPWAAGAGVGAIALALVPWGLGCFSSNSAQQARLGLAAPAWAAALMALNTSAIYAGQALGAAGGGALIAGDGFGPLPWVGLAWIALALALSAWGTRTLTRRPVAAT